MLREYRLTNFKAFGETVTIPIRPLTLIFGANSSGKSSIFQSLLLLKQTLEESENPDTALLPKGSLVDLGTYSDFIHRHETGLDFQIEARFTQHTTEPLFYAPPHIRKLLSTESTDIGLNIRFSYNEKTDSIALHQYSVAIGDELQPITSYFPLKPDGTTKIQVEFDSQSHFWRHWWNFKKEEINKLLQVELAEFGEDQDLHPLYPTSKTIHEITADSEHSGALFEEVLEALKSYFNNEAAVTYGHFLPMVCRFPEDIKVPEPFRQSELSASMFAQEMEVISISRVANDIFLPILRDLVYLGPLRSQPQRHYEFSSDTTDYVGQKGEYLPSILFQKPGMLEQINKDLKDLGVKYKLRLDKLQYENGSPSSIFSLRFVHTGTDIDASSRDVGFGISQVLPIVVQSRLAEKKTLLIEQPEIHLHPAHQAELGDLFIRSAKEQGNTLLLETHSENLILRILRRIRETNDDKLPEGFPHICPEDVAVLYVQPGDRGARVIEIPATEDGDFDRPWPQGFFEESIKELV